MGKRRLVHPPTDNKPGGNRPVVLTALLVIVIGIFAWSRYTPPLALPDNESSRLDKPQRAQVYLGPRTSIAVLPFTGNPDDESQAFWAPGFSRELHRLITRMPGLQVTSLNSSFFAGLQGVSPALIAERLRVRHLLSGEFHESGGNIRIHTRLHDAKRKADIWSGDYEGSLGEVFEIENKILVELVEAIRPAKKGSLPRASPVEIGAWQSYLKGVYYIEQNTLAAHEEARQAFESALEIAPNFGLARVGLARLWLGQAASEYAPPDIFEEARNMLDEALLSEPARPIALGLLSYMRRSIDWDWAGALDAANQAVQLDPGNPELMSTASLAMFSFGQFQEAGELLSQSVSQDPLNLSRRLRLGLLQEFAGEYDEAVNTYRQILALNSDYPGVRAYLARVRIIQEEAETALEESAQETAPFWHRYSRALALTALGRKDEAHVFLDQMITDDGDHAAYQITEILALGGETDRAFEWFLRAFDQHDGGMGEVIGNHFLENLHDDPRWKEMMDRLGLPP